MSNIYPLDWHPKEFFAGDLDNSQSSRLLGTPKLSGVETLIREMAQNSWDARLEEWQPSFNIDLREGTEELKVKLRTLLQNGEPNSPLELSLADPHFHVLEIADRGTSGLDGPIDMREGDPSNFQDLILKVGVPRSSGQGGGTFGFGKTAAYGYSRIGTVIFWTRCLNLEGELEHRLIVSAFRDKFDIDGVQYTGRHWWGTTNENGELAPIVGDEAQRLGEDLFQWGFPGDETGTSMLILHPPLRDTVQFTQDLKDLPITESEDFGKIVEQWTEQVRLTIRSHLWPKLIDDPDTGLAPMLITLTVNGSDVELRSESKEMMDHWGEALNAVRSVQYGLTQPKKLGRIQVHEVTRQGSYKNRTKTWTLGHLSIVLLTGFKNGELGNDLDPEVTDAQGRVVRLRNIPELVINSKDFLTEEAGDGLEWIAVFKPTEEFDDVYAKSEPPAHDDWVAEATGLDSDERLIITHTENKIRRILRDVIIDSGQNSDTKSTRVSTKKLSKKLSGLVPEERDVPASSAHQSAGKHVKVKGVTVSVLSNRLVRTDEKVRQVQELRMVAQGDSDIAEVQLEAMYVGTGSTAERIDQDRMEIYWEGAEEVERGVARATIGREFAAYVHADQGRALKLTAKVRA